MNEKTSGLHIDGNIGSVGGGILNVGDISGSFTGDIVAGNKTIINNIIQRIAKELTTTPYKFLASYDIADRDIFYGRNAVIDELAGKVGRAKVLLINGASGAGKTSLVNAGLIPRVADNGYTFVAFREYSDPLAQLQDYFARTAAGTAQAPAAGNVADEGALLRLIQGFGALPMVIFLDQFERFFVRVPEDKRRSFIAAFKHCLANSQATDLSFVLGFRREFLGQLTSEFEEQIPEFLNEAYRINLMPLSRAEAREAIVRPLANAKRKIIYDPKFVDDVLLTGLAEQTGSGASIDPPHLQIVCNQLYEAACRIEERDGSALINAALYEELGGVGNILNTYLDKVVEDVAQDPERIAIVHSILKTMVDAGSNTRAFVAPDGFRRTLPDVNEAEVLKFIEKLLDRRVIEERKPTYSLSHEHMVAKVKEWFDPRELERKRAEETLGRGMMEWKNSGALLNRKQVEGIRTWVPEIKEDEQQLLAASEARYLQEERNEADRIRTRRRMRRGFYALGGVIAIAAVIAGWQWYEADKATAEARSQANKALAGQLGVQAKLISEEEGQSIDILKRGAAYAVESWNRFQNPDAWQAARQLRDRLPVKSIRMGQVGQVRNVGFLPGDNELVILYEVASDEYRLTIVDLSNGLETAVPIGGEHPVQVGHEHLLAGIDQSKHVVWLESSDGKKELRLSTQQPIRDAVESTERCGPTSKDANSLISWSPDCSYVAQASTSSSDVEILIPRDEAEGNKKELKRIVTMTGQAFGTDYIIFHPTSKFLVGISSYEAESGDQSVNIWRLPDIPTTRVPTLNSKSLAFRNPRELSAETDEKIWRWRVQNDLTLEALPAIPKKNEDSSPEPSETSRTIWASPDGKVSAEPSGNGTNILTFKENDQTLSRYELASPISDVLTPKFSPDGQFFAVADGDMARLLSVREGISLEPTVKYYADEASWVDVKFSRDHRFAAMVARKGESLSSTLQVINLQSRQSRLKTLNSSVFGINFTNDGNPYPYVSGEINIL